MTDRIFCYTILIWSEERVSFVEPFASVYFPEVAFVLESSRRICAGKRRSFKGNGIGTIETTGRSISESFAFYQNRIGKARKK